MASYCNKYSSNGTDAPGFSGTGARAKRGRPALAATPEIALSAAHLQNVGLRLEGLCAGEPERLSRGSQCRAKLYLAAHLWWGLESLPAAGMIKTLKNTHGLRRIFVPALPRNAVVALSR
jgi:hypothetical protein